MSKINDPNFLLELAVGPPMLELVTQQPGTGLRLQGLYTDKPRRFLFKKAHMSAGAGAYLVPLWCLPAWKCLLLHSWLLMRQ